MICQHVILARMRRPAEALALNAVGRLMPNSRAAALMGAPRPRPGQSSRAPRARCGVLPLQTKAPRPARCAGAVDEHGDVIDIMVQSRRDRLAGARFFRQLLKGQGVEPRRLVMDTLRSYSAAHRTVMPSVMHGTTQYENDREEIGRAALREGNASSSSTIKKLARPTRYVVATVWGTTSVTRFIRPGAARHSELDGNSAGVGGRLSGPRIRRPQTMM